MILSFSNSPSPFFYYLLPTPFHSTTRILRVTTRWLRHSTAAFKRQRLGYSKVTPSLTQTTTACAFLESTRALPTTPSATRKRRPRSGLIQVSRRHRRLLEPKHHLLTMRALLTTQVSRRRRRLPEPKQQLRMEHPHRQQGCGLCSSHRSQWRSERCSSLIVLPRKIINIL